MKKLIILSFLVAAITTAKSQATYFQTQVKKSASGTSLEFYMRPNPTGSNINLKFDNLDFFLRWPSTDVSPITGAPVVNTIDFPGLTITQQASDNPYGPESGYVIREWTSPSAGSTNTAITYTAGQEYLVFSVPVSNVISSNIELAGNNEDGIPYYFTVTKNTAGVGGESDQTSHNVTNGSVNNQLFYGASGSLSETPGSAGKNFYQKITFSVLPVKFTSFSANKKDDNAALNWTVENETSAVDRYEIERSLGGSVFDKLTTLQKSNSGNGYSYLDRNISAVKSNGLIYYRVKQIDVDGRFVYSEVKNVKNSNKNSFISNYPNPVHDITTLQINAPENIEVSYSLLGSNGKTIQRGVIQALKGINRERISMTNYTTGNYLLKVMMGNNLETLKIIKE